MSEYIKRDDVIDLLEQVLNVEDYFDYVKAQSGLALWFEEQISELPKADVVPVVRCKDCKYNKGDNKCLNPNSIIKVPSDFDYCSHGERK